MTDSKIGPRSDRRPTDAREIVCCSVGWAMFSDNLGSGPGIPRGTNLVSPRWLAQATNVVGFGPLGSRLFAQGHECC
jgi:hypothetical protein